MANITFEVESPNKKEQKCVIYEDGKEKDFIILSERFWAKPNLFKQFIKFLKGHDYKFETTQQEIKLRLEHNYQQEKNKDKDLGGRKREIKPEVMNLLKDKKIFTRYIDEIGKRVVNEKPAIKSTFVNSLGSTVKNSKKTSFNSAVNSKSNAGKSLVAKAVTDIFPSEIVAYRTRISPNALNYWHNSFFEPNWTWDGKILFLEDISNDILNCPALKVMMSEGSIITVVIQGRSVDIEVKGKPVVIMTFAESQPKGEILSRMSIISLDESREQTKNILKKQAQSESENLSANYDNIFTQALEALDRINVIIPYANEIVDYFPTENIIARRYFPRFLDLIKAVASLHRYQRTWKSKDTIESSWDDYNTARDVLLSTVSNVQLISLTKTQKQILEYAEEFPEGFAVKEIYTKHPILAESKWYENIDDLTEKGFFSVDLKKLEDSKKPVKIFLYKKQNQLNIPKAEEILEYIKRGNTGNQENEGNTGIEGNDNPINSLISLNSLKSLTPQNTSCSICNETWICKYQYDSHPICNNCIEDLKQGKKLQIPIIQGSSQ